MPLVAHNQLPTFARLRQEGIKVLAPEAALAQDIRELHIGLLNMMPDAALAATERQFMRLVGESNPIAQFYVHPFTLDSLPRTPRAEAYIANHYESFDAIREQGLDALIITGANVEGHDLTCQPFWRPLIEVADWAHEHVTSTLCSCLATHAVLEFRYGQKRTPRNSKKWGVFRHRVIDPLHPLVNDINTCFDVPHSRWNEISREQFDAAGLPVLVECDGGDVHLATSHDGIRTVFFQGHPEYDTISLLKEYKREVQRYQQGECAAPPFPEHYFGRWPQALLNEFRYRHATTPQQRNLPEFPEAIITPYLDNTWRDTADEVIGNWMGLVYHLTHSDRHLPFMAGIDPDRPLAAL
ncbi:MAG: homoserine O-succinyltransferase [Gammaproteobacteria bacterium]|nr:homoserine O-succinyltransferase [Gammaproteobacteria bacterium]